MDNPYLRDLLYRMFRDNIKAWPSVAAGFSEWSDRTSRTPDVTAADPDIDRLSLIVYLLADPLRLALHAKYKHRQKTLTDRAAWCRVAKREYRKNLHDAERLVTLYWEANINL